MGGAEGLDVTPGRFRGGRRCFQDEGHDQGLRGSLVRYCLRRGKASDCVYCAVCAFTAGLYNSDFVSTVKPKLVTK